MEVTFHGRRGDGQFDIPLLGAYQAYNVAAAGIVTTELGLSRKELIEGVRSFPKTLSAIKQYSYGKSIILDDSYNSNPTGFQSALEVMAAFKDRHKIVITRGMMELAERSEELHEKIGGDIAFMADELVIISKNSEKPLRKGVVSDKYRTNIHTILDRDELKKFIESLKEKETVVLFENRLPRDVYESVMNEVKHSL